MRVPTMMLAVLETPAKPSAEPSETGPAESTDAAASQTATTEQGRPDPLFSTLDLVGLLGGGLLLALILGLLGTGLRWLELPRTARSTLRRLTPAIGFVATAIYLFFCIRVLFEARGSLLLILLGLLLLVFIALAWYPIRDIVSGVFAKTSGVVEVGDHLGVGEIRGRVVRLGIRSLLVERPDGSEAVVPFSELVRGRVQRRHPVRGAHVHGFIVTVAPGIDLPTAKRAIREAGMRSHWSSPVLEPKVEQGQEGLEVTVFPLDLDYASEIEALVRAAVATSTNPRG